ncbi:hypothetical protein C2G38_2049977 [Gigaspora rosea]|uniref:BED-type domain-containing protein n=1 Tax=Gigaspora rosea TaxID=44941 RepID=A0A397TWY7_9GLOM|nr:hypothetical protein C2G38_2049977 [Gigaspora rosea]
MSDSDLEQTSQTEYSQETSNVSQSESSQTKQNIQKKNKCRHQSGQLVAKCWKYFEVEGEQSIYKIKIKDNNGGEKICGTSYKYLPGWSTTNMNSHLADEHDIVDFQKKVNN